MYRTVLIVALPIAALLAAPASAITMTFDALPSASQEPTLEPKIYTENGITASTSGSYGLGYSGSPGKLHLDDGGTSIAGSVDFSTGGLFTAVSFDVPAYALTALEYWLYNPADSSTTEFYGIPYANVGVKGFRNGALVAEDNFYSEDFSTYFFDALLFADLDQLIISAQGPSIEELNAIETAVLAANPGYTMSFLGCFNSPCGHFNIDNLVLDPLLAVPLPGSLPMFALGFLALGIARRQFVRAESTPPTFQPA